MKELRYVGYIIVVCTGIFSCTRSESTKEDSIRVLKGLYVFGPELKSFTDCTTGGEYWVADSAKTLELGYANLNFEKPYEPVYVEFECNVVVSDTTKSADFDSTLVVRKVLRLSKTIPDGPCAK